MYSLEVVLVLSLQYTSFAGLYVYLLDVVLVPPLRYTHVYLLQVPLPLVFSLMYSSVPGLCVVIRSGRPSLHPSHLPPFPPQQVHGGAGRV